MNQEQQHGTMNQEGNTIIYRDYANVPPSLVASSSKPAVDEEGPVSKDNNFPVKFHYALREMEKDGLQHIVSWQPHGRSFLVHDPRLFEKKYLPLWFRQHKIASFRRQLNMYGFTRITHGKL